MAKIRRVLTYTCIILMGSIALPFISHVLGLQYGGWQRGVSDTAHMLWGVMLVYAWWFIWPNNTTNERIAATLESITRLQQGMEENRQRLQQIQDVQQHIELIHREIGERTPPEKREFDCEL